MLQTGGVGMAGSDGPPDFDIVTQLQQNLGQVTLLLYNFIGTTQRDAGPASIKGEGIIAPSSSPSLPVRGDEFEGWEPRTSIRMPFLCLILYL